MSEVKKITEKIIQIITENPTLPIIAMVNGEIMYEDYGWYLASISDAVVGECACYNERCYDDRNEFKENYYDWNDDALCAKFGYDPRKNDYAVKQGKITAKQFEENRKCEMALDRYLDELADKAFSKAIVIYISPPEEEDYKEFMGSER